MNIATRNCPRSLFMTMLPQQNFILELLIELELLLEGVFERELHVNIVRVEAVEPVVAASPNYLTTEHDVVHRVEQQIAGGVVSPMEGAGRLTVRVRDV